MKENVFPIWSERIPKSKIKQLYIKISNGIIDEELIDDVGYGLLCRCHSFIKACKAVKGEIECPVCKNVIIHNPYNKGEMIKCDCGWELLWDDYFSTIQHKQLSGAEPILKIFQNYIDQFEKVSTPNEKIIQIDILLHSFHIYLNIPTRPAAINLIEGRLPDIIQFLNDLSDVKTRNDELTNKIKWQNTLKSVEWLKY